MAQHRKYRSSDKEEREVAFRRAIKVLLGAGRRITRQAIARQATQYLPEGLKTLEGTLRQMNEEEFAGLFPQSVKLEEPPLTSRATRPIRTGRLQ